MQSLASEHDLVQGERAVPLRIWLAPVARTQCEQLVRTHFPRAEIAHIPSADTALRGPAVIVLDADDIGGPDRRLLRSLADLALPGRPIILGGTACKHTLLDAINNWRAVQLIRRQAARSTLLDALKKAYGSIAVECSIRDCVGLLRTECDELAAATVELRATQERLLHAERLATVGRMVGSLLSRTREQFGSLERIRSARTEVAPGSPLADLYDCAVEGIDSFGALLEDMLALTDERQVQGEPDVVQLSPLVERCVRLFLFDALGRQRDVEVKRNANVRVRVDPPRLCHVMLNLLRNAAQATEGNQKIIVRTQLAGDWALIEVEDFGHGMTEETLASIFTPFFTTKGEAGMGLGLRLAKSTVESHGGTLSCTSTANEGTCFRIQLPAIQD